MALGLVAWHMWEQAAGGTITPLEIDILRVPIDAGADDHWESEHVLD